MTRIDWPDRLNRLTDKEVRELFFDWAIWARAEQWPPEGSWTTWLLMGGRGAGKTRAGAEWVRSLVAGTAPVSPIALVSENLDEARRVMVEGPSGLLSVGVPANRPKFERGRQRLVWSNGAEAHLMSASDPERFRGPQFAAAWVDEAGKWPHAEAAWDMLQFALRLGDRPRQLVTTTPRPTRLIKRLLSEPGTVLTRMTTEDNRANLAPGFLSDVVGRYQGTRLGRQELNGELIEDREDGLWSRELVEACRTNEELRPERIVVAVDPAVSAKKNSDACGIIVAARAGEKALVLADRTLKPPRRWGGHGAWSVPSTNSMRMPLWSRPTRAVTWSKT